MKVISGKLKGRNIKGFDIVGTRPTMDRVKESIFSMIQDYINNSVCLDLFAGSGNLGIESLSNGALTVYFNDYNKKCIQIIRENLENFNVINNSIITNMDYLEALNFYKNKGIKFDVVFLDPPYKKRIINKILEVLEKNNLLNDDALVICEMMENEEYLSNILSLYKERSYGDKIVKIYKCFEKNVK